MNNNYNSLANKYSKDIKDNKQVVDKKPAPKAKTDRGYSYYSRVLEKPFDSIEELKEAEATHYAKLRAKEDQALKKKADAKKVEDAFKALNVARKTYKDDLAALTHDYSESLTKLKTTLESERTRIKSNLAAAEEAYSNALKTFTEQYPEGYHLTLKDGDFETTIDSCRSNKGEIAKTTSLSEFADLFSWIFG